MFKKITFLLFFVFACFSMSSVFAIEQIDINTATLAQLDTLTGIGPKYAQAIIDARPFSSIDDLLKVKGIGPKTLQKIKDQGLAYVKNPNVQIPNPNQIQNPVSDTPNKPTDATPTPTVIYPSGVFINEILPNPKGSDETDEWIELYNSNNLDIDLTGWQLQDTTGTITTYTIPQGEKILANGFLVFKRPDTKIMLNNDQDGLNLLTPDGKIIDSVKFTSAPLGQSYNKISGSWQWSLTTTPGTKNTIPSAKTSINTSNVLSKTKNSVKNDGVVPELADLSQTLDKSQTKNPWFLFLTVLATTIILSIIVLLIKLKLKNHVRT